MASSTSASSPARCRDVFCFWTNKGGVGKTALTFHSAISYAKTNPDKQVIVCDCDSQANLSRTLLTELGNTWNNNVKKPFHEGADVMKKLQGEQLFGCKCPKTILGFFMARHDINAHPEMNAAASLLVDVHQYNSSMPENVKLLCGDQRLQCIVDDIMTAQGQRAMMHVPWVSERMHLRNFLDSAAKSSGRETVVFIDTNPTLDIFTEIALVSSTKLVVPLMFDDYSTAALRNMIYLLHGLGRTSNPDMKRYEETVFWSKVREHKVKLPRIQTVIFNRTTGVVPCKSEQVINDEQYQLLFQLMSEIEAASDIKIEDVFNLAAKPPNWQAVDKMCCFMRDMHSAGIMSMRYGLPLWAIKRNNTTLASCLGVSAVPTDSIQTTLHQLLGRHHSSDAEMLGDRSVLKALTGGHDALKSVSQKVINEVQKEATLTATQAWGKPGGLSELPECKRQKVG